MNLRVPDYYEQFQCTASACRDNCCIGWEIDIDEESDRRYRQEPGLFGARLRSSIQREGATPCFRMEGERCVFLNERNLCDLILNLGEGALCQICRDHPRFTESFGTVRESGVGLCCEAAARLILTREEPMQFVTRETEEKSVEEECPAEQLDRMLAVRDTLFEQLQNRVVPLAERMCMALHIGEAVQAALDEGEWADILSLLQSTRSDKVRPEKRMAEPIEVIKELLGWLEVFSHFEAINGQWTELLNQARELLSRPETDVREVYRCFRAELCAQEYEGEQLLIYFLFRYFLQSVYTGDCLTPIQLAVVSCILIGLLELTRFAEEKTISLEDRIQLAALYSKEMEYSEENWSALQESLIFNGCFTCETMKRILTGTAKRD